MSTGSLPPLARSALLLDFDGTLIDIAPTPDSVVVPPCLPGVLARLRDRLGGALAIVTGRAIEVVDALMPNTALAIAGEHGATIRHTPNGTAGVGPNGTAGAASELPVPPAAWHERMEALVRAHPGLILEPKRHGFALHYRARPELRDLCRDAVTAPLAGQSAFGLLAGLMLWEIRAVGVDKGGATRALMAREPFQGRTPIFIGDDVTDEDGMAAARALGGVGLRVDQAFGTPDDVRAWLRDAAETGHWPPYCGSNTCD